MVSRSPLSLVTCGATMALLKELIISSDSEIHSKLCNRPLVAEFQGPRRSWKKIITTWQSWEICGRQSAPDTTNELLDIPPNDQTTSTPCGSDVERAAAADLRAMRFRGEVSELPECAHLLHSRCLAIWWLGNQMNCPVCGAEYWLPDPSFPPRIEPVLRRVTRPIGLPSQTAPAS